MAFSHIRGDVSNKQEDRFHCWPHMVELTKAHSNNLLLQHTIGLINSQSPSKGTPSRSTFSLPCSLSSGLYAYPLITLASPSGEFSRQAFRTETVLSGCNPSVTCDHTLL